MMTQLLDAVTFATNAHADQLDKNGRPYIMHPFRVMLRVQAAGGTEDQQIAAVLHDVVEDCDVPLLAIERTFGPGVAVIVNAVSRRSDETYRGFIARVLEHPTAILVKLCDIQDNQARTPVPDPGEQEGLQARYRWANVRLEAALEVWRSFEEAESNSVRARYEELSKIENGAYGR